MNFQDNEKNSVQSLLALLRSTQDGPTLNPLRPGPIATPVSSGSGSNGATGQGVRVPSSSELSTLLRSLNPPPAPSTPTRPAGPSTKGSRNLIEPFGPVKDFTSPSAERKGSAENLRRGNSGDTGRLSSANVQEAVEGRDGDKGAQDVDMGIISFIKCLPRLSELMGDEKFMLELRKMKADQDALERRLWAKEEKLKAEHERSLQAEKDIARIAQRPISADKRAQWAANLDLSLQEFHLQTCLPSLDSLSKRHRERLGSLGVPGLGGDVAAEGTVERWRRIMDLLQAGLE